MNPEPRDPDDVLSEAALTATDGGGVDWDALRALLPDDADTIEALEQLATVVTAHHADDTPAGPAADGAAFRWGPLEVRRRTGAGTFGEVFLAWDPRLQREVALKLRHGTAGVRAWLEEARRLARVRHPNVVTVHGADVHDGRAGIWMERIRGATLEERLRRDGPLSAREATIVGAELCAALAAVHGAGLVHGDVKTHNVMREGGAGSPHGAGRIVLMDFGSARESASPATGSPGTPLFTAPEVLDGGRTTAASDLWSLGVVLYRLVTGAWPVEAATVDELRERLANAGPPSLRAVRPDLPAGFVRIVERALERDPRRRWSDATVVERELLAALGADHALDAERSRLRAAHRRRARRLGAAALVVACAVLAWAVATYGERVWMAWRMRERTLVGTTVADVAGVSANAFLGSWVMNVGDLDGDGLDEVAAAANGVEGGGEVYVCSPGRDPSLRPVLTLKGEQDGDLFGTVAAGDLNGDGHRDLVVAAILHDGVARDAGRVSVYFGGRKLHATPDVVLDGTHAAQYFGYGLGVGDVNGDRVDDLLVGAVYDNRAGPVTGRAWAYFGGASFDTHPDLELSTGIEGGNFGMTVAPIGDFDGDGYDDFAVGAPGDPGGGRSRGATYVYDGGPHVDDRPDLVLTGTRDGERFGAVRQRTGDLNGDGRDDLAIASESGDGLEPRAGEVRIWFGGPDADGTPDRVLKGERRGDGFGTWVDGSRDVDGDGDADLLVTAPWHDTPGARGGGRAYVYLGGRTASRVPDYIVDGPIEASLGTGGCLVRTARGMGGMVLGLKNENRHYIQCGGLQYIDLERWSVSPPAPRDGWRPGGVARLHWRGRERCDVALSVDDGRTWRTVARHAGGSARNGLAVHVPPDARGQVRVRLATAAGRDTVERTFTIGA